MSSFSDEPSEQRSAPRSKVRLSARVETYSRYSLDSQNSSSDQVTGVVINDLSTSGLSTGDTSDLHVGAVVRLQIPLVGWRNAEVRWIRDGHAGCKFLVPLREEELRSAIASSPLISSNFPGLVPQITLHESVAAVEERRSFIARRRSRGEGGFGQRSRTPLIVFTAATAMMAWAALSKILH